jgi:hypothetical protein
MFFTFNYLVLLELRYFPNIRSVYETFWVILKIRDLKRSGRRWKDNIKMAFKESEYEAVDWIRLM